MTCEHGGNAIPPAYRSLFRGREALLASHRGYDAGALGMARTIARALGATLVASTTSRLLVELNRSPGRQFRQSPVMREAPADVCERVTRACYVPYRRDVEAFVRAARAAGWRVLHVSSHSFTPALDGMERRADVGLLYDPSRAGERALCLRWQHEMRQSLRGCVVRRNYPYLGRSDGLTSWLRKRFADDAYVGVELEVNQKHVGATGRFSPAMEHAIAAALCAAVASFA